MRGHRSRGTRLCFVRWQRARGIARRCLAIDMLTRFRVQGLGFRFCLAIVKLTRCGSMCSIHNVSYI